VLGTATATCVATEALAGRAAGKRSTLGDWSAVVTGLLYGLTLPASLPLWMVVVGGVVSMASASFLRFSGDRQSCPVGRGDAGTFPWR
jgi:electron transport complex protein RnfD